MTLTNLPSALIRLLVESSSLVLLKSQMTLGIPSSTPCTVGGWNPLSLNSTISPLDEEASNLTYSSCGPSMVLRAVAALGASVFPWSPVVGGTVLAGAGSPAASGRGGSLV